VVEEPDGAARRRPGCGALHQEGELRHEVPGNGPPIDVRPDPAEEAPVLRERREREERERAEGSVRIGELHGLDFPGYAAAYVSAAHTLASNVAANGQHVMAIPCVFLQRHALETILKDILQTARFIADGRTALRDGRWSDKCPRPWKTHSLLGLVDEVSKELRNCDPAWRLPDDITSLATELKQFEGDDHTRLRYARDQNDVSSFPRLKLAKVGLWQKRLETIERSVRMGGVDWAPDNRSLYDEIAFEAEAICEELSARGLNGLALIDRHEIFDEESDL
jgi:hypothetical protein